MNLKQVEDGYFSFTTKLFGMYIIIFVKFIVKSQIIPNKLLKGRKALFNLLESVTHFATKAQPIGIKQIFRSIIWLILSTQKSNVG